VLTFFLKKIYTLTWLAITPIIPLIFIYRIIQGKESYKRINERIGFSLLKKPEKKLVWINAVSLGELRSTIPLIKALIEQNFEIIVTTVTLTSANHIKTIIDNLDSKNIIHQFTPIDHPLSIKVFLNHWNPSCIILIESEIWPNLISQSSNKNIPLILLQGRITEKSYKKWLYLSSFSNYIFQKFCLVVSQDNLNGKRFEKLGSQNVIKGINLKNSVPAPYMDQSKEKIILSNINKRQVLLFASIHNNIEDEAAISSHIEAKKYTPDLLSIIVPRHPKKIDNIIYLANLHNLQTKIRSFNQPIDNNTDIYIADTIGELGSFFKIADICFMGGTLSNKGGHNLIEPAMEKCAIIYGPDVRNHQTISAILLKNNASIQINNIRELNEEIINLTQNKEKIKKMADLSYNISNNLDDPSTIILNKLKPYLKK
jgi:3-deoxy-D-manno-octulosonic-acid transferase